MLYPNEYLITWLAEDYRNERLREFEARRLLREAGLDHRGWVSRQARGLLQRWGRFLVALGQRLERYGMPTAAPSVERRRTNGASLGG